MCRAAIASELEPVGDGFNERWLVVDVMLHLGCERADLDDLTIQYCDAARPCTYIRGTGRRRRWEMTLDADDTAQPDDAYIWSRLARWITERDGDLVRGAVYTFRSAVARKWREEGVFLAGDAAHLMPPFMGQGMCAGVRDVANLAWKLGRALAGGDPHGKLLDSYETERRPHVLQFIELSVDLGRLMNQVAAAGGPPRKMTSIWPRLGPGLGPRDAIAGTLAPQPVAPDGRRADDIAGGGPYVLARARAVAIVPSACPTICGAEAWLEQASLFAALVRPDGYVLATAERG